MKKISFYPPGCPVLFMLAFMASCCGQSNSNALNNNHPASVKTPPKTGGAQIDDYVVEAFEDKKGNLWFGTMAKGAARFDGKTLSYFTTDEGLCGNTVTSIAEDQEGNMWFGTHTGASKYDGKTFTNFGNAEGLHGAGCNILVDRNGHIWAGTNHVEDLQGNIWFGTLTSDYPKNNEEGGLSRYDGKNFTRFPALEGLTGNDIYTIYRDKKGDIWIGATRHGAYRYDGEKFTLFKETDRKDLTVNFGVQSMLEDKNGTLWVGFSGGLFRFNGTSFDNVTQDGPWK